MEGHAFNKYKRTQRQGSLGVAIAEPQITLVEGGLNAPKTKVKPIFFRDFGHIEESKITDQESEKGGIVAPT